MRITHSRTTLERGSVPGRARQALAYSGSKRETAPSLPAQVAVMRLTQMAPADPA